MMQCVYFINILFDITRQVAGNSEISIPLNVKFERKKHFDLLAILDYCQHFWSQGNAKNDHVVISYLKMNRH